jgi:hypothetical protein
MEGTMMGMVNYDDLINRYRISMEMKRVGSIPITPDRNSSPGVRHYKCHLSMPGKTMEVYFSAEASAGTLTLSDVLHLLAMDSSACRMLEGYEETCIEWASLFADSSENLKEFEDFWHEYRWRCKQSNELKAFLGETAYEQLVRLIESQGAFSPDRFDMQNHHDSHAQ